MSNSIITSLFWVRKNWARSIPLEYETINNIEENPKIKKISKVTNNKIKIINNKIKIINNLYQILVKMVLIMKC